MIGKMHIKDHTKLFACCDKELLNKTIVYNNTNIYFSSSFYGAKEISEKEFLYNIEECTTANIFGKESCNLLLKNKIILKEQIITIGKIQHTQIYKI